MHVARSLTEASPKTRQCKFMTELKERPPREAKSERRTDHPLTNERTNDAPLGHASRGYEC